MPFEVIDHEDDFGSASARERHDPVYQSWEATQAELLRGISYTDDLSFDWSRTPTLELVGGIDVSFVKGTDVAVTSLVVLEFSTMKVVYESYKPTLLTQPAIPGFASFREIGPVLELIRTVREKYPKYVPQVLLVEGNGKLHPRKFGLASHVGISSGIPTIGVSKKFLQIDGISEESVRQVFDTGAEAVSLVGEQEKQWGLAFAPANARREPIYISVGHKISLKTAAEIVKACTFTRLPEPIRKADQLSRDYIGDMEKQGRLTSHGHMLPPPNSANQAALKAASGSTKAPSEGTRDHRPPVESTLPAHRPQTASAAYRASPTKRPQRRQASPVKATTPRGYTPVGGGPTSQYASLVPPIVGLSSSSITVTSQSTPTAHTSTPHAVRRDDATVVNNNLAPTISNNMLVPLQNQPQGWWEGMYGYQSGWNGYGAAVSYWNPWGQWGQGVSPFVPIPKREYQEYQAAAAAAPPTTPQAQGPNLFRAPSVTAPGAGTIGGTLVAAPAPQIQRLQRQSQFGTLFSHSSGPYSTQFQYPPAAPQQPQHSPMYGQQAPRASTPLPMHSVAYPQTYGQTYGRTGAQASYRGVAQSAGFQMGSQGFLW